MSSSTARGPSLDVSDEPRLRKQSLKIWFDYSKERWPIYALGIVSVALACTMQVMTTRILGWILDFFGHQTVPFFLEGTAYDRITTFKILFFLLITSWILLFLSRIGWRRTLTRQTHWASAKLKTDIWKHVRFFKRRDLLHQYTKGVLMNATTSDVNTARFIFGFTLVGVFDTLFLGLVTTIAMFSIHPPLTLWVMSVFILLPLVVKKISDRESRLYRTSQEFLGSLNELASQIVSTIRLQRFTHTGMAWRERFLKAAEQYRRQRLKAAQTTFLYIPTMGLSSVFGYLILLTVGVHLVLQGELTLGSFVAMQGLIFMLQGPMAEFGTIVSELKRSLVSLDRLSKIYTHPKDPHLTGQGEKVPSDSVRPVLQVSNLSFRYPSSGVPLLRNFHLSLQRGERVGFYGPIGSGKSTLLRILSGIERRIEGSVQLCGRPLETYQHQHLRQYIGLLEQESFLFASNIRQNICLDRHFSDDEIWHFLNLAELASYIMQLPYQLETPLGEVGVNLSGGQKQRLALARALARRPQLLFLDDCLSAVDSVTEKKILAHLDNELKDTAMVWVAHRKSTLKYCHRVMELK